MRSRCTSLDNTVSDIRGLIDTIEQELTDQLTELQNEVRKGLEENDAGEDE